MLSRYFSLIVTPFCDKLSRGVVVAGNPHYERLLASRYDNLHVFPYILLTRVYRGYNMLSLTSRTLFEYKGNRCISCRKRLENP